MSWYWFCPHSPSILLFFQKGRTREESDNHTGFEQFSRLAKGIKKRLKRQTVKVQLLWLVQCHAHSAVGFFLSIHVFMSTFFVNKCWMLSSQLRWQPPPAITDYYYGLHQPRCCGSCLDQTAPFPWSPEIDVLFALHNFLSRNLESCSHCGSHNNWVIGDRGAHTLQDHTR